MIIKVVSSKTIDQIESAFPEVCAKYKFGLLGFYNLRQKLNEKGVNFGRECRVFEVCNPQQAKKVLEQNMAISTALPCRIAAYEDNGRITLATIKPTVFLKAFTTTGLEQIAEEVENTLVQIMKELT